MRSTLTASKLDSKKSRVATSMMCPVICPACSLVGRPLCGRALLLGLALVTFIWVFSPRHSLCVPCADFAGCAGRGLYRSILLISACIRLRKCIIVRYRMINRVGHFERGSRSQLADSCAFTPRGAENEADDVDFPNDCRCRLRGLPDGCRRTRQRRKRGRGRPEWYLAHGRWPRPRTDRALRSEAGADLRLYRLDEGPHGYEWATREGSEQPGSCEADPASSGSPID